MPGLAPRQAAAGIALVVLLHLALVWLATRPVRNPVPHDDWVWVPLKPPPEMRPAPPIADFFGWNTPHEKKAPARRSEAPPPSAPTPSPSTPERDRPARAETDSPEERALLSPPPLPGAAPADNVAQRALNAVGAIDRQLRAEHRQEFTAPPDTPHARLLKGLQAAHAAVGPKWFEAARTELVSAPNDPKRVYRVTTALGEYCLYFPDKAGIAANADPKSGWAGFGQPTMASCPIPF